MVVRVSQWSNTLCSKPLESLSELDVSAGGGWTEGLDSPVPS